MMAQIKESVHGPPCKQRRVAVTLCCSVKPQCAHRPAASRAWRPHTHGTQHTQVERRPGPCVRLMAQTEEPVLVVEGLITLHMQRCSLRKVAAIPGWWKEGDAL